MGINSVSDETWERTFPLSALLLIPFIVAYVGGVLFPILAMLWGLISIFVRFEGKKPVWAGIVLLIISFVSVGVFVDALSALTNLPTRPPQTP
jgi:hypothetical protein